MAHPPCPLCLLFFLFSSSPPSHSCVHRSQTGHTSFPSALARVTRSLARNQESISAPHEICVLFCTASTKHPKGGACTVLFPRAITWSTAVIRPALPWAVLLRPLDNPGIHCLLGQQTAK